MPRQPARGGFTLIECLVVMAVGALLISLAIAALQTVFQLERAGTQHKLRQAVLARVAARFRGDVWSATAVAEEASSAKTLHFAVGDEQIVYTIEHGTIERSLRQHDAMHNREVYELPGAAFLGFEIAAANGQQRISLLCAERQPQAAAHDHEYKKPLRLTATLGRDRRYIASQETLK